MKVVVEQVDGWTRIDRRKYEARFRVMLGAAERVVVVERRRDRFFGHEFTVTTGASRGQTFSLSDLEDRNTDRMVRDMVAAGFRRALRASPCPVAKLALAWRSGTPRGRRELEEALRLATTTPAPLYYYTR